jgi:hypothetical protein
MCVARCICCGAECACCCFRCCAGCCGSGGRGHKRVKSDPPPIYPTYGEPPSANAYSANPYAQAHAAAPPAPPIDARPINQQYRSNAMPTFNPVAASQPARPQFATFDSTRAVVNDDALPAMPTWKDGRDVHVQVEEQPIPQKQGDMELERLDRNGSVTSGSNAGLAAAAVPGARRSPGAGRSPISPVDGYSAPPSNQDGSFVGNGAPLSQQGGLNQDPYGRPYAQQDEYRRGSPAQNLSPDYGAGAGYGQQQPYGRRLPGQPQVYGSHDQVDQYSQRDVYAQYNQQGPYSQHTQQIPYDQHSQQGAYGQRDYYDEPQQTQQPYRSPSPPSANQSYDNFAPAPMQQQPPSLTPGYPASESTALGSATSAYPGQRSYTPVAGSVGQQQPYRAFTPVAQGQQYSGVQRKPLDGTYREI